MRGMTGGVTLLAALVFTTGTVYARGPRTGAVMTPYGPLYNTGSAEWRMAGGNPLVYAEIMEEKMYFQQQQMFLKQQQQMLKQQQQMQKQQNAKGGTLNGATTAPSPNAIAPRPLRKKKRRTYVPTHPAASPAPKAGATTGSATSPRPDATKTVTPNSP